VALIVDVGRIEEVDAGIKRGVYYAARCGVIDTPSEIIAAQTGE
jgi:hypothetical protein